LDISDYLYINGEKKSQVPPSRETKTDIDGYYKTPTGAVISKDYDSLKAYKLKKCKNAQLNNIEERVSNLEKGIDDIKKLLERLVK
jgi:hypothetical protein